MINRITEVLPHLNDEEIFEVETLIKETAIEYAAFYFMRAFLAANANSYERQADKVPKEVYNNFGWDDFLKFKQKQREK